MEFLKISNIKNFFDFVWPISVIFFAILMIAGLIVVFNSPEDVRQGLWVKMLYFHVPFAWIALLSYLFLTMMSILYLSWKFTLCSVFLPIVGQIGTFFCALCLITGMIWGHFTWGVWWAWDVRMTSMLMLFLFFLTHFVVRNFIQEEPRQNQIISILTILGFINIPIIKFSVEIWTSVHQKNSLKILGKSQMPPEMIIPLLIMFFSFCLGCAIFAMWRFNRIIKSKKIENSLLQF